MSEIENNPSNSWIDSPEIAAEVFEALPLFCIAVDANGKVSHVNQAMLKATHYTRGEVIGQPYASVFLPEEDTRRAASYSSELKRTSAVVVNENRVRAKDGVRIPVEWYTRAVYNERERLTYFLGVGVDLSERRRAEEALRRSEQKLALHVQQTSMGIIEWATDFTVAEWNPASEKIFGYTREEAMGMVGLMLVPEPVRSLVNDVWSRLLEGRATVTSVNENVRKDGAMIVCDWHNTPLIDSSGKVMGVASMISDVTEQKRREEDLRRREREQKRTIEELSAPVLDVARGVLLMPVIGQVDDERARRMMETLLASIVQNAAQFTIIDLTGLKDAEPSIAGHLTRIVHSARLLGARCLVSGVSAPMARMLTDNQSTMGDVPAFGTLRAALSHALSVHRF